jgi:hypothetical protein
LSPREREVVGEPEDYEWDETVELPARIRSDMTQFSLRVERALLEGLQALAREQATSLSEIARDALDAYLVTGGRPTISNIQVSFALDAGVLVQVEGGATAQVSPNQRSGSPDKWETLASAG